MSLYYIMSKSNKSSSDTNTSSAHSETMVPPTRRGRSAATATDANMDALFADLAQSSGETKTPSFEDAIFDTPLPSTKYIDYLKKKKAARTKGKKTIGKKTRKRSGQKIRNHPYRSSSSSSSSQSAHNPIFEGDVAGPSLTGTMSSFEQPASTLLNVDDDWAKHGVEHTYNMGLKVTPGVTMTDDKTVTQDKTNDGKKGGGRKSKKRKSRRRKTRKHKKKHRKRKRKTKRKTKRKKHKRKRKTKRR